MSSVTIFTSLLVTTSNGRRFPSYGLPTGSLAPATAPRHQLHRLKVMLPLTLQSGAQDRGFVTVRHLQVSRGARSLTKGLLVSYCRYLSLVQSL
jgi:hypothetical protein